MTGLGLTYARCEHGASAGEYALLLAIVAGCAVVALHHLGGQIGVALNGVSAALR
jgi:Flp pilus assembly pilin Flp